MSDVDLVANVFQAQEKVPVDLINEAGMCRYMQNITVNSAKSDEPTVHYFRLTLNPLAEPWTHKDRV